MHHIEKARDHSRASGVSVFVPCARSAPGLGASKRSTGAFRRSFASEGDKLVDQALFDERTAFDGQFDDDAVDVADLVEVQ